MTENPQAATPQAVRSRARGRTFWGLLVAPWPIGVLGGLACSLVLGIGMAIGIASGLAIALGLNFMWVVITFEIDDGEVDHRARDAAVHEGTGSPPRGGGPAAQSGRDVVRPGRTGEMDPQALPRRKEETNARR